MGSLARETVKGGAGLNFLKASVLMLFNVVMLLVLIPLNRIRLVTAGVPAPVRSPKGRG